MANKSSGLDPELTKLLRLLGLEGHLSKFASENVCDMETLAILTTADMRDLGLKIGDRAKLRHELFQRGLRADSSRSSAKKRPRPAEISNLSAEDQINGTGASDDNRKTRRTSTSNGTGDRGRSSDVPKSAKNKVDHGFIFNGERAQEDLPQEDGDLDDGASADGGSEEAEETVFEEVKGVKIVVNTKELGFRGQKNAKSGGLDIITVRDNCPFRDEVDGAHCTLRRILTMEGKVICNCDELTLEMISGHVKSAVRPMILEIDKLIPRKKSEPATQGTTKTEEEQEVPLPDFDDEPGEAAGDAQQEEEQEVPLPDFDDEQGGAVVETAGGGEASHALNDEAGEVDKDHDDNHGDDDIWTITVIHEDGEPQPVCMRLSKVKKMKRVLKAVCKDVGANPKDAVLVHDGALVPLDMPPTELGIASGEVLYFHRDRSSLSSLLAAA